MITVLKWNCRFNKIVHKKAPKNVTLWSLFFGGIDYLLPILIVASIAGQIQLQTDLTRNKKRV